MSKPKPIEPGAWAKSDEGRNSMRNVLNNGGIPLELRSIAAVEEFLRDLAQRDGQGGTIRNFARTLNPGEIFFMQDGTPREVDCVLTLTQLVATTSVSFSITARVPIECKHRNNVEWFAFEMPASNVPWAMRPLRATLFGGPVGMDFAAHTATWDQLSLPERRITSIDAGNFAAANDRLLMEVAAASFDYVMAARRSRQTVLPPQAFGALEELRIQKRFDAFASGADGTHDDKLRAFCMGLTTEDHQRYLSAIRGHAQQVGLELYVPILCVNGPLFAVTTNAANEPQDFTPLTFAAARMRLQQWPGGLMHDAINTGAAFPVVLAPVATLKSVLDFVDGMVGATAYRIGQLSGSPSVTKLPLEIAVRSFVVEHVKPSLRLAAYPNE